MMVAMHIHHHIGHQVLLITGLVPGDEDVTEQIADVVLLQGRDPCANESIVYFQMGLRNLGVQVLALQVLEQGLEC